MVRYYNDGGDGDPHCRYATLEQCVADMRPTGGSCGPSPYPPSPGTSTRRPSLVCAKAPAAWRYSLHYLDHAASDCQAGRYSRSLAGPFSRYCLFLAAAGGAVRTSAHGSDFFFSLSGSLLIVDW
jgi:hypothetical protein